MTSDRLADPVTNAEILASMKLDMERRGLMKSSIDKRIICLKAFMRWMKDTSILDADRDQVQRFLDGRNIGSRTRFAWLAHFGAFYGYCVKEGFIEEDPTARIVRPKLRATLPRPAATDDIQRLLEAGDPKERCWVLLGALQGLRCKEIAGLRREDVLDVQSLLRVKGKGDKERFVPIHPEVRKALDDLPMPRVGWIFTRIRGGPYTANWLSAAFNRFLHENGVNSTAHQLRHWFGTQLYSSTHDLRLTQEMLGHSDPGTTAIYTAFDRKAASAAVKGLSFAAEEEPPEEAA